jgi:hypothetical protein
MLHLQKHAPEHDNKLLLPLESLDLRQSIGQVAAVEVKLKYDSDKMKPNLFLFQQALPQGNID